MRILLIEDEELQGRLMNTLVQSVSRAEFVSALDAFDGFAILNTVRKFDLIIVDYDLPYCDGLSVVRKIRASEHLKHIPIILTTGCEVDPSAVESAGVNDLFLKGTSVDVLQKLVKKYEKGS